MTGLGRSEPDERVMRNLVCGKAIHRNPIFIGVVLGLVIFAILSTASGTPRARVNVMLASAVIFIFTVLVRGRKRGPSEPIEDPGGGKVTFIAVGLSLSVGCLGWIRTLDQGFISDDFAHFFQTQEPLADYLVRAFMGQAGTFLRPLGFLSLYLDEQIWGNWPAGFHLTNLILHLAGIVGVYFLCENATLTRGLGATASLLYAVFPVQAEAVGWIAARFDLLAGALTIWSAVFYLRFRDGKGSASYSAALVLGVGAMLAKENAYLLPVLLLLVELFLVRPARLKPVLPFGLLTMAVLIYRLAALGSIGGYAGDTGAPAVFDIGLETIEGVLLRAPALSLLGLNWLQPGPVVPIAAFLAGLLLAIAFCSRLERHTRSVVTFGLGWILVAAAPAHPLLLIGPSLTNSRVLYLGTLGGAILVAALLTRLASRQIRNVATASVVILFVLGVGNNVAAWRYASDLSTQFLEELQALEPAPAENTQFVFYDLPDNVRGVFFFRIAFTEAVRLYYERDDISAYRAELGQAAADLETREFTWVDAPDHLIERR